MAPRKKKAVPTQTPPPPVSEPVAVVEPKTDVIGAWERHGLLGKNILYAHSSSITRDVDQVYTIGCKDSETAFVLINDGKQESLMFFSPTALEELKWRIDDVLVEMGLASVGVASANEHVWKSSPRRK